MKVCVIGNSHAACIKRAWDEFLVPKFKDSFELTFFAARGQKLKDLALKNGELVPLTDRLRKSIEFTSDGFSSIRLKEYDVFLLVGLQAKPFYLENSNFSSAVTKLALNDNYVSKIFFEVLTKIRKEVDSKIYIGHTPLPKNINRENLEHDESISEMYLKGLELANDELFKKFDAELLPQPAITLTGNSRNTHSNYSVGSTRLSVGDEIDNAEHLKEDRFHMNTLFGKAWLEEFFEKLLT
jgi:hypothetical protein